MMIEETFICSWCNRRMRRDELHSKEADGDAVCCYCYDEAVADDLRYKEEEE
jgi:hypothetical protein